MHLTVKGEKGGGEWMVDEQQQKIKKIDGSISYGVLQTVRIHMEVVEPQPNRPKLQLTLAPNQNGENIDEFFEFSSEWWSRQTTRQRRKKLFRNFFQYKFKMRCCVRRRTAILIRYTLKTPSVQY